MANVVLYESNGDTHSYDYGYDYDYYVEQTSTGWFESDESGFIFGQLSGSGVTYDSYDDPVLGVISSARSIGETGETRWLISGVAVQASNTSYLNWALASGNVFYREIVSVILSGDDKYIGSEGDDFFYYSAGKDSIEGGAGNDSISFWDYDYRDNMGNSLIVDLGLNKYTVTTRSNVVVNSVIRNIENLYGSDGNDRLTGDANDNFIVGYYGADVIHGGDGHDVVDGGRNVDYGDDQLYGDAGNDTIISSVGDVYIDGGIGSDYVSYSKSRSRVNVDLSLGHGKHGSYNSYYGQWDYSDTLISVESVIGTSWADTIYGSSGENTIAGGAGDDLMNGFSGVDTLDYITNGYAAVNVDLAKNFSKGQGRDSIYNFENVLGSSYNDTIFGNAVNNCLVGNAGNDMLKGFSGLDSIDGGNGNDVLHGGLGRDSLSGGLGNDRFVFDATLGVANIDRITDFAHGVDKIVLDDDIFTALSVGTSTTAMFRTGAGVTTAATVSQRLILNTSTGALYYDANGSAAGAAVQIAVVQGAGMTAMTAGDFLVVA